MNIIYNYNLIINSSSEQEIVFLETKSLNLYKINACGAVILFECLSEIDLSELQNIIVGKCLDNGIEFNNGIFNDYVDALIQARILIESTENNIITDVVSELTIETYKLKQFNPRIEMILDMSEGFFSKIFIE